MRLAFTFFALLGLGVVHAGEKLEVASLSTVLTDIAQNVGGDKVQVNAIVKAGIDPHEFTPSTSDVKALSKAKVVLLNGNGMEGAYLTKLEKSVGDGPVFVAIGKSIKPIMVEPEDDHDHGTAHSHEAEGKVPDPHWWHSIKNAEIATEVIRDAFISADPANKATYEANAKAYLSKLENLSKWAKLEIAQLARNKRVLVTSHDALGYFARDYGFTVYPIEGISTKDQPSSKKVRDIIEAIKDQGVKAIFVENIENPKVLTEITKETGAKIGGTLYSDALGEKQATTYENMIRYNYSTIVNGLQ